MECKHCIYYERAHYRGTPPEEIYDECIFHNEVLHDLDGCVWFKDRDEPEPS